MKDHDQLMGNPLSHLAADLPDTHAIVGRYYDVDLFESESSRLSQRSPVEFWITCRYLTRYIPPAAIVADVGVGVGHYAEFLARQRCTLHLVDVSERLLQATHGRLKTGGLDSQLASMRQASATDLSHLPAAALDAVLLLGPLYHLLQPSERRAAVQEAARVIRPGGTLIAAGINRLAYFRDTLRQLPATVGERRHFHARFLVDGNLDPVFAPPIGYAHLTTPHLFRQLFDGLFEEVALVGLESFASTQESQLLELTPEARETWLDLIESTGRTPEGLHLSDHYLFIGRKP